MKKILLFTFCFFTFSYLMATLTPGREKYNFNSGWKVFVGDMPDAEKEVFDDSSWKSVTLPYSWNEDDAFRLAINRIPKGIAWYRKTFTLPESGNNKKIVLEFEGLRQAGTVYVNGHEVILHENGVMAFGVDITEVVRFDGKKNTIAVRTDNSSGYKEQATDTGFQWNHSAFYVSYGGINKGIMLHILPRVYQTLPLYSNLGTTGIYVYAADINVKETSAVIHCESEIKNETTATRTLTYEVRIEDMENKTVGRFEGGTVTIQPGELKVATASGKMNGLNFWSWGYGYLYKVITVVKENEKVIDEVVTRTGFRKTGFGEGMVWLNDRVIQLKGYAQRSTNEWPAIGSSVPAWLSDYSNRMVVEGNGNLIRWMHVTPWKQDVESCDRVGLIHAMPAGDSEKDVEGRQWNQRLELMRDAIIYNRNNPSILFYECGNKRISYEHMEEMKAIRDQYDPNGGRAIGSREMLDIDNAEWGGEMLYVNHSAKHPMWATEYMRNEGLRKYWDEHSYPYHKEGDGPLYREAPAPEYNMNQDKMAVENIRRWFDYYEARPGTGRRVSSGGAKIIFSDSNTHMRGEENYRRSGVVDPMRIAKDGYGVHRVMWNGWVDAEEYLTYIIGHWNYPDNTVKDIYVVSAAAKVELLLNGKPLGTPERAYHFLHTFRNITFEAGELTAISYDERGIELSSYTLETAGEPISLRMTALTSPTGMLADGHDLALVEIEVVDSKGRRCPLANNTVSFYLSGPAQWRGGIAQGADNHILSEELPVECGVNRVLLRSTPEAGTIILKASSEGLIPTSLSIGTSPVKEEGGLSQTFQAEDLPSYLEKGATPLTPSYQTSRYAIEVASVQAGSNQEEGWKSFDDNEMSQWSNDGQLSTAWISYQLEKEAELSEICIKLAGWRSTSYPIETSVEGKKVWSGTTPKNLGYATMRFDPVKGKEVTIRLTGSSTEEDAFSGIVEVDASVELDAFRNSADPSAKGLLRIVEVEFYEAATAPEVNIYIAKYKDNKECAISYTFDDGLKEHYTHVVPELEKHGFRGTFWVNGKTVDNAPNDTTRVGWTLLKEMVERGHEVSNHGWSHANLKRITLEEVRREIEKNDSAIYAGTGLMPVTFCYPYNAVDEDILRIASENRVGTRTKQFGVGTKSTPENLEQRLNEIIETGDWGVAMIHGINYGYDAFPDPTVFWEHLEKVSRKSNRIWVGTFRDVASYIKEQETTTLGIRKEENRIVITPRFVLENTLFKEPLTAVIENLMAKDIRIIQGNNQLNFRFSQDTILFEFDPAGETIVIAY